MTSATRLLVGRYAVRFALGGKDHFEASRLALGPSSLLFSRYLLFVKVNQLKREAIHSPPLCAVVKNRWIYTSTPAIRLHSVDRTTLPLYRLWWVDWYFTIEKRYHYTNGEGTIAFNHVLFKTSKYKERSSRGFRKTKYFLLWAVDGVFSNQINYYSASFLWLQTHNINLQRAVRFDANVLCPYPTGSPFKSLSRHWQPWVFFQRTFSAVKVNVGKVHRLTTTATF